MVTARGRGSSPHTRGAPSRIVCRAGRSGIIPAYAGSTSSPTMSTSCAWDHPRIRGEHCEKRHIFYRHSGSSPHTRGALTPPRRRRSLVQDHPRIRGEHLAEAHRFGLTRGSSPHTRGALDACDCVRIVARIIPAYAGSTEPAPHPSARKPDHPRIRGEHKDRDTQAMIMFGSSPHTRGAPSVFSPLSRAWRIIPAYAGSTAVRA